MKFSFAGRAVLDFVWFFEPVNVKPTGVPELHELIFGKRRVSGKTRGRVGIAFCLALLSGFANIAIAATFVVNSTGDAADVAPGNGSHAVPVEQIHRVPLSVLCVLRLRRLMR